VPPNRARVSGLFTEIAADTTPRGMVIGLRTRWVVMTVFAVIAGLALIGVFGQRQSESTALAEAATVRLAAPKVVRGGLYFQSRLDIRALRAIEHPRLVLDEGWMEGMQINSSVPTPVGEASRNGRVVLSYDGLDRGDTLVVWLQFQVNPTNVGHRSYDVELDDSDAPIAHLRRDITILP
jgi:hypothetical protein